MGASATQVWFGPPDRPLHAHLWLPADGAVRGGVVLCPPMGEESRACHRTYRRTAEALADAGLVALHLDYDGTGDSSGAQDDPDRVAAWQASVEAGRAHLRGLGVDHVAALGMRLGATIAACQAAAGGPFDALVLWDPCQSGRTFLREGEALYAFSGGIDDEGGRHDIATAPDDGLRHTPGFQYDADTARALRTLDLSKLPAEARLAPRVLLLTREDRPAPAAVVRRVRAEPGEVTERPAHGQHLLLDVLPSDTVVPADTVRDVVAWLAAGAADLAPVHVPAPAPDRPALVPSAGAGSLAVREQVVRLGPLGLFGVATQPEVDLPADAPWVALVNVAAEHHVGPGRQWVELARGWAALGYRSVRFDQSGVGDSPAHPGQVEDAVYADAWLDDVPAVVEHLGVDGAPVALVGLCSGGYSAFETALRTRVAGIFTINPRVTLYTAAEGEPLHSPRRRAARVVVRPVSRLSVRHRLVAGGLWRIYRQVALWHAPMPVLARVSRRVPLLRIVACRLDAREFTEVAAVRPWLWWLQRRSRAAGSRGRVFSLEVDDVFDHSLLTRRGQQATRERATAFVEELHERHGSRRTGRTGRPGRPGRPGRARRRPVRAA